MAKTKTPFLSLEASGSVGGKMTAQRSRSVDIVRTKPIPTDPRSLAQIYQRWDYQDYIAQWNDLTEAAKQIYKSAASRRQMTGLSLFMQGKLKDLPDLAARWRLDARAGSFVQDTSRNANHGTNFGATPASFRIDYGLKFDGINDMVQIPSSSTLINFTAKSVLLFFQAGPFTGVWRVFYYAGFWHIPYGDHIRIHPGRDEVQIRLANPAFAIAEAKITFTPNKLHHLAYSWDGTTVRYYLDGEVANAPDAFTGPLACSAVDYYLGRYITTKEFDGYLDHVEVYNRALTPSEIKQHSERRYP